MADEVWVNQQNLTKEKALVIPLDRVRTQYGVTVEVVSGVSSILYTATSGQEVYVNEAGFFEMSGNDGVIQLFSVAGSGIGVPWNVAQDKNVVWDPCPCAFGPIRSGITVQMPKFAGEVHLILTVDPKWHE